MKRFLLWLIVIASFGCASRQAVPRNVQLKQDVLDGIRVLDVLAKGIMAAADTKPPVITVVEANRVLDAVKASVRVLQVTNVCAKTALDALLTQLDALEYAARIRPVLLGARISIGNGLWPACSPTRLITAPTELVQGTR